MVSVNLLLPLAGLAVAELSRLHMKGSKFFDKNGNQFFMKGIAYQQDIAAGGKTNDKAESYLDPLADPEACARDVPELEKLGVNTIRTYAIDPEKDHSECMQMLDDAGIYVISDLSQPKLSIRRDAPEWNVPMFKRYVAVVDELAQYSNVIGFFAGNEVSDAKNNTQASAYVKAALRDTKGHIRQMGYEDLGVGYASNDHPDIRKSIAQYFFCTSEEDEDEMADFWGYNIYSWCGESTMAKSGYNQQIKFFEDYNRPVFFAEYGCNNPGGAEGRIWQDTEALYNDQMTEVFSGGIVYMYFQEENDYGVVKIKGGKAVRMKNFDGLAEAHANADPKGIKESDYTPGNMDIKCPKLQETDTETWHAHSNLPPKPDEKLCQCAAAASSCKTKEPVDGKGADKIFGFVCGEDKKLCASVNGNPETGNYGAFSMCGAQVKVNVVLGAYYDAQNGAADACDFDGLAEPSNSEEDDSCTEMLDIAKAHNDKVATATGSSPASTGGSDSDEEDFGAINAPARLFSLGNIAVGLYMVVALGVGAAMIAL